MDFFYKLIFFIQRKCGIYHSGHSTTRACLFLQILGDFALFSMNDQRKTSEEDLVTKSRHSSSEVLQTQR